MLGGFKKGQNRLEDQPLKCFSQAKSFGIFGIADVCKKVDGWG